MGVDALVRQVLRDVGLREERFSLRWASAAEAPLFVRLITDFTEEMRELGPLGQAEGLSQGEVKERLQTALDAVSSRKVRISFGNAAKAVRKDGNFTRDNIDAIVAAKMEKSLGKALVL